MNKQKILILIGLIISIASLGLAYAALTQTLSLSANVKLEASKLDVRFDNYGGNNYVEGNGGSVVSIGEINSSDPTKIAGLRVSFAYPGSYVEIPLSAFNYNQYFKVKLYQANVNYNSNDFDILSLDDDEPYDGSNAQTLKSSLLNNINITIFKLSENDGVETKTLLGTFTNINSTNTITINNADELDAATESGGSLLANGEEDYIIKIEYSSNYNDLVPAGYYFNVSNLELSFEFEQVVGSQA